MYTLFCHHDLALKMLASKPSVKDWELIPISAQLFPLPLHIARLAYVVVISHIYDLRHNFERIPSTAGP